MIKNNRTEIDYKSVDDKRYKRYMGLGHYTETPSGPFDYFPEGENLSIEVWKNFFENVNYSMLLNSFNYFIIEFNNHKLIFKEVYGDAIFNVLNNNYDWLNTFILKWYSPGTNYFYGLDFSLDGSGDGIKKRFFDRYGCYRRIEFSDGSKIRFINDDDDYRQLFVLQSDFQNLENDIKTILGLLK